MCRLYYPSDFAPYLRGCRQSATPGGYVYFASEHVRRGRGRRTDPRTLEAAEKIVCRRSRDRVLSQARSIIWYSH